MTLTRCKLFVVLFCWFFCLNACRLFIFWHSFLVLTWTNFIFFFPQVITLWCLLPCDSVISAFLSENCGSIFVFASCECVKPVLRSWNIQNHSNALEASAFWSNQPVIFGVGSDQGSFAAFLLRLLGGEEKKKMLLRQYFVVGKRQQ